MRYLVQHGHGVNKTVEVFRDKKLALKDFYALKTSSAQSVRLTTIWNGIPLAHRS